MKADPCPNCGAEWTATRRATIVITHAAGCTFVPDRHAELKFLEANPGINAARRAVL